MGGAGPAVCTSEPLPFPFLIHGISSQLRLKSALRLPLSKQSTQFTSPAIPSPSPQQCSAPHYPPLHSLSLYWLQEEVGSQGGT